MVKLNQADTDIATDIDDLLGYPNITMTKKEAFDLSTWISNMVDLGDFADDGIKESAVALAQLIETVANLGDAYSQDQDNVPVELMIACDYYPADAENEQENVDETTKAEGLSSDAAS